MISSHAFCVLSEMIFPLEELFSRVLAASGFPPFGLRPNQSNGRPAGLDSFNLEGVFSRTNYGAPGLVANVDRVNDTATQIRVDSRGKKPGSIQSTATFARI